MKRGVINKIFLCLTFLFLIGLVSAWSVDITNPVNGSYFGSKPAQFSWTYSGIDSNNLSSNLEYNVNGNVNYGLTSNSNQAIGSSQVIQGWNIIILSITNITGQTENASLSFWVDSISPILTVLNPLGNIGYTNTNILSLFVELQETNKGGYQGDIFATPDSSNKYVWRLFNYPLGGGTWNSYTLDSTNISDISQTLSNPGDLQEGNYTFIIKARDKYPNGTTIREVTETGIIIRDITAPTITDDYANDGVWINLDQIVTLTPVDALSYIGDVKYCEGIACGPSTGTILGIPYQLNYNTDQNTIVRYQVWDLATNPSIIGEYNVRLDKTAPVTTDDYANDGVWVNADQTITLIPIDALSGVADTFYRINSGSWNLYSTPIIITDEGINILEYYSTDVAGNIESVNQISVMIDKSLPVSLITSPLTSSWHNSDFNIGRSDTDTYSGLNFCETRILDNTIESLAWTPTPCNTDYLVNIISYCSTQGIDLCEAQIRSADNVAWISNVDIRTFSIDTTPPVTNDNAPAGWQNANVFVTLTADDTLGGNSGVANTFYCVDQTDTCIPGTSGTIASVTNEGTNYIRYYSTDVAGNTEIVKSVSVQIDKIKPLIFSAIANPNPTKEGLITITINVNELNLDTGISPAVEVIGLTTLYNLIESSFVGNTWIGTFNLLNDNEEATATIKINGFTDLAGNVMDEDILNTFNVDTLEPAVNSVVVSDSSISEADNGNQLTLTIFYNEDMNSGINPIITFNSDIIASGTLIFNSGSWINANTYQVNYNMVDINEEIVDIDVIINGAQDIIGNVQNIYTEIDAIDVDTISPSITTFQAIPTTSISENNPTIISAVDVSDLNLDFTGLMFVDFNNLISSDQILFSANMNDAPVSGAYGPINWPANYFKITDGTTSEPVGIFITDFAPTEYVVTGYLQKDPAIPTPLEDCMLGFNIGTNELTTSYCGNSTINGVSKFTISSLKFTNGIFSQPVETNQSTFTLYDLINPALNPKLESALAPTGNYTAILRTEDLAENENAEIINISVDNTFPFLTSINLSSSVISPINADGYLDDLTITMNANELVDWGTLYIYNSTGDAVNRYQSFPDWVLSNSRIWDGQYNSGYGVGYVPDGTYTLTLTTTLNKALNDSASNINSSIFVGSIIIDNTLPILSNIQSTNIGTSSATITWTTNENANSTTYYGTTPSTTSLTGSATFVTAHSISLSSLSASTLYYYNVSSCDAAGNCNTSTQYSFTTSTNDGGTGGGSSGGGGGGGGSSSSKYYTCSIWNEWSACSDSKQSRICLEKITTTSQKGVIESKFNATETKDCTASVLVPLSNSAEEDESNGVLPVEESTPGFFARVTGGITGAATGMAKSKSGKISLIVIGILALMWAILVVGRRINRKDIGRKIRIIHKEDLKKR